MPHALAETGEHLIRPVQEQSARLQRVAVIAVEVGPDVAGRVESVVRLSW